MAEILYSLDLLFHCSVLYVFYFKFPRLTKKYINVVGIIVRLWKPDNAAPVYPTNFSNCRNLNLPTASANSIFNWMPPFLGNFLCHQSREYSEKNADMRSHIIFLKVQTMQLWYSNASIFIKDAFKMFCPRKRNILFNSISTFQSPHQWPVSLWN